MNKKTTTVLLAVVIIIFSCNQQENAFQKDLDFLKKYDDKVIVLSNESSKVIVSPRYQAKVFTSTAGDGSSYGWINYPMFDAPPDPHMNAYGGENRIWLGPEGGPFSLFFPKDFAMTFANWKIPAAFDTEPWELIASTGNMASLKKDMKLKNYAGTEFSLTVDRKIQVHDKPAIEKWLGVNYDDNVKAVGYLTENSITNRGSHEWTDTTGGLPCIWILDMFPPSPNTTIVIPYKKDSADKAVNTNYFGEIPSNRIKYANNVVYFKGDGKMRSKLGVLPGSAKNVAGSYDEDKKVLTITVFDVDPSAKYLNMEWSTEKPVFSGDAVNAYNDGPLEDGRQLGPFYELESVSPAAFLKPGQTLTHNHSVFHFSGDEAALNAICEKTLGVSLEQVKSSFK